MQLSKTSVVCKTKINIMLEINKCKYGEIKIKKMQTVCLKTEHCLAVLYVDSNNIKED